MTKPLAKTQAQRLDDVERKIAELDKVACDVIDRTVEGIAEVNADIYELEGRVDKVEAAAKRPNAALTLVQVGAILTITLTAFLAVGLTLTPFQIALPLLVALGAGAVLTFAEKKGFQWFVLIVDMIATLLFGALLLTVLIPGAVLLGIGWLIIPARDIIRKAIKIVTDLLSGLAVRGKKRQEFATT